MKKAISSVAILVTALVSMSAQANVVFNGGDNHGNLCRVEFASLQAGPVVMHNACEFETDGPGPWCDHSPAVPVRTVVGAGSYQTLNGHVDFTLNDKWARPNGSKLSAVGDSNQGYVEFNFIGANKVQVRHDFLTNYGKTLTPAQIYNILTRRAPGTNYAAIYASIYTTVICNAQRQ
jgi:hypothetical protein